MSVRRELNLDLKIIKQEYAKFWEQHPAIVKMAVIPRNVQGHEWLRPTIGVVELHQCTIQVIPLSSRKTTGGLAEGIAPFLQLPHFSGSVVKKIGCKKARTFEDFFHMSMQEHAELLEKVAGFFSAEIQCVGMVLEMMPSVTLEVKCETEDEEGIKTG